MQHKILQLTLSSHLMLLWTTGYILVLQYMHRALKTATMILLSGSHRFAEGNQAIHIGRES